MQRYRYPSGTPYCFSRFPRQVIFDVQINIKSPPARACHKGFAPKLSALNLTSLKQKVHVWTYVTKENFIRSKEAKPGILQQYWLLGLGCPCLVSLLPCSGSTFLYSALTGLQRYGVIAAISPFPCRF